MDCAAAQSDAERERRAQLVDRELEPRELERRRRDDVETDGAARAGRMSGDVELEVEGGGDRPCQLPCPSENAGAVPAPARHLRRVVLLDGLDVQRSSASGPSTSIEVDVRLEPGTPCSSPIAASRCGMGGVGRELDADARPDPDPDSPRWADRGARDRTRAWRRSAAACAGGCTPPENGMRHSPLP